MVFLRKSARNLALSTRDKRTSCLTRRHCDQRKVNTRHLRELGLDGATQTVDNLGNSGVAGKSGDLFIQMGIGDTRDSSDTNTEMRTQRVSIIQCLHGSD